MKNNRLLSAWNNDVLIIFVIFVSSFAIRFLYILQLDNTPVAAALEYTKCAQEILRGNFWWGTLKAPLYPYFLSFIYSFYELNYHYVRIAQALISALTCVMTFNIGKKIFSRGVGIIAAIICALSTVMIFYSGVLLPQTLFTFFVTLLIYKLIVTEDNPTTRNIIITGIVFGIAALINEEILFFAPFMILGYIFSKRHRYNMAERTKLWFMILALSLIVIIPYTMRNYLYTYRFVLITSTNGENLWIGNNPYATGKYEEIPRNMYARNISQPEMNERFRRKAVDFIRKDPKKSGQNMLKKIKLIFACPSEESSYADFPFLFGFAENVSIPAIRMKILLSAAIIGLLFSFFHFRNYLLLYGLILGNILMQLTFYFSPESRVKIIPVLSLFAGYFVFSLFAPLITIILPSSRKRLLERLRSGLVKKRIIKSLFLLLILLGLGLIFTNIRLPERKTPFVVIQGENPVKTNFPKSRITNPKLMGGFSSELQVKSDEADREYFADYEFTITKSERYKIWLAGTLPGTSDKSIGMSSYFSPFSVSVNNNPPVYYSEETYKEKFSDFAPRAYAFGGYHWMPLGVYTLSEGKHTIEISVSESRKIDDYLTFSVDAIIIVPSDWKADKKHKDIPDFVFEYDF